MEEILIDCIETDVFPTPTSSKHNHGHLGHVGGNSNHVTYDKPMVHETQFAGKTRKPDARARLDSATNVIMMYSPDIPAAEHGYEKGGLSLANYYASIETEESIKCMVSTALFGFIMVAFFVVTFVLNPQM